MTVLWKGNKVILISSASIKYFDDYCYYYYYEHYYYHCYFSYNYHYCYYLYDYYRYYYYYYYYYYASPAVPKASTPRGVQKTRSMLLVLKGEWVSGSLYSPQT